MSHSTPLDSAAARSMMVASAALARGMPALVIVRHIAREVQRVSGADTVAIYQLDSQAQLLMPIVGYHVPKGIPDSQRQSPLPLSRWPAIAAALHDRQSVKSSEPHWLTGVDTTYLESLPPHAALVVPMIVGGQPVGIVYIAWWSSSTAGPACPSPALPMLATSAGVALQSLLAGRDTARKQRHTEALLAVSRALSSTLDFYSVIRHLLRSTARALSSDMVGAYVLQDDGEWLVPLQGYRLPPDRVGALRGLKLSVKANAFYATGSTTRRVMFSSNVFEEPGIPDSIRTTVPHRAQMFVPIVTRDRLLGGLVALWVARTPEVQPADVALIESIAAQAGVVVENARLLEANARRLSELSSLHGLARSVTRELERTAILSALHGPLGQGLAVDTMELYWRGRSQTELQLLFRIVEGTPELEVPRAVATTAAGLASIVAREGRPIRTRNFVAECRSRGITPPADSHAYTHWLGVPALAGEETLGVLAVAHRQFPFTATHENFLAQAAQLVALALGSAALYDDRVRIQGLLLAQEHVARSERLPAFDGTSSHVARDFNDLLAAILFRAQLLRERVTDPQLSEWLRVIERSVLDTSHASSSGTMSTLESAATT